MRDYKDFQDDFRSFAKRLPKAAHRTAPGWPRFCHKSPDKGCASPINNYRRICIDCINCNTARTTQLPVTPGRIAPQKQRPDSSPRSSCSDVLKTWPSRLAATICSVVLARLWQWHIRQGFRRSVHEVWARECRRGHGPRHAWLIRRGLGFYFCSAGASIMAE